MIQKKFRLQEKEVKKVLQRWKPFFSHGVVMNSFPNKKSFSRFALVIGAKSIADNVSRNKLRRIFYKRIRFLFWSFEQASHFDIVFVVKKQKFLDKKDENSINSFVQDIDFLVKKSFFS